MYFPFNLLFHRCLLPYFLCLLLYRVLPLFHFSTHLKTSHLFPYTSYLFLLLICTLLPLLLNCTLLHLILSFSNNSYLPNLHLYYMDIFMSVLFQILQNSIFLLTFISFLNPSLFFLNIFLILSHLTFSKKFIY